MEETEYPSEEMVSEYIAGLKWSRLVTPHEINFVIASIRRFASHLRDHPAGRKPCGDCDVPDAKQLYSACMSFRHDFGLLSDSERRQLVNESRAWHEAWRKAKADDVSDAKRGK